MPNLLTQEKTEKERILFAFSRMFQKQLFCGVFFVCLFVLFCFFFLSDVILKVMSGGVLWQL